MSSWLNVVLLSLLIKQLWGMANTVLIRYDDKTSSEYNVSDIGMIKCVSVLLYFPRVFRRHGFIYYNVWEIWSLKEYVVVECSGVNIMRTVVK